MIAHGPQAMTGHWGSPFESELCLQHFELYDLWEDILCICKMGQNLFVCLIGYLWDLIHNEDEFVTLENWETNQFILTVLT